MDGYWKPILLAVALTLILVGCSPTTEAIDAGSPTAAQEIPGEATPRSSPTEPQSEPAATEPPQQTEVVFLDKTVDRIPVIFSHGGGPCDIAAMAYLVYHPHVELIGMVLSRGEFYPAVAVDYWPIYLYDVLGSTHTALGIGTDLRMDPNSSDFPESWRQSSSQFWNLPLPDKVTDYQAASGHELIIDLVNDSPEKVTILAMASMIDVALALQEEPGIVDNISQVVIMGGAFTVPGNLDDAPYEIDNEVAEWNIWIDAEAARILFNSGVPISIVPLDGIQYFVDSTDLAEMNSIHDPGVDYVAQMWNQQMGFGGPFLIWNTITVSAVTNPENFYWTYDGVDVVTEPGEFLGQTIPLNNGSFHTRYATGADYEAVMDLVFDVLRGDPLAWEPAAADTSGQRWDPPVAGGEKMVRDLGGTWEGFTGDFHIIFTIQPECRLNQVCGTFEIPEFSLEGDISFVAIEGNIFEFVASNLSAQVEPAEYEYLELRGDGRLNYVSQGSSQTSRAILDKQ
jgi:inosine-uridine nucleoside N-ribohydrolase